MRAITHRLTSCLAAFLFVACGVGTQESEIAVAAKHLEPFKQELQQALRDGLAQGPVEAIAACRVRAPEIASSLSRDGIRLGRTSHRLRNPSNVAPGWVRPLLDSYESRPSDRAARTVALPDDRSGYVEPILVQPLCLTCHGGNLAPEVASRIEALYPNDRAVGYQVGDLRGVFWMEFPRTE